VSADYRNHLLAVARRVRANGPLHPLVVIEGADDPPMFFDANPYWGDHRQRRQTMRSLGGLLGFGLDAQRIYVAVEMWIAQEEFSGTDADVQERIAAFRRGDLVPPSERPDRQSAIQVMELTPTESPAGMVVQVFKRRKGKLRWAPPREWQTGEHVEDWTFGEFWHGVAQTVALGGMFDGAAQDLGIGDTFSMRRAARRAAVHNFGEGLFEEHEIGRVMRRWSK
jgi:hypothetical protein